jgi:Rieske Fe-S protein
MMEGVSNTPSIPASAIHVDENKFTIMLDAANGLKEIGGKGKLAVTPDGNEQNLLKLIVVHPEKDSYLVFADKCTHGGRELNYKHKDNQLVCSSFGHSTYDLKGRVLSGPAPRSLASFKSELKENQLIITV